MKIIRQELGEDTSLSDADDYQEKAEKLEAEKEVKENINSTVETNLIIATSCGSGKSTIVNNIINEIKEKIFEFVFGCRTVGVYIRNYRLF